MKKKKNILRRCHAVILFVGLCAAASLFVGCDTANLPEESRNDTTSGDQIIEESFVEKNTTTSEEDTVTGVSDETEDRNEDVADEADSGHSVESVTVTPEKPTEPETAEPEKEPETLSYEAYHSMSAAEQEAHFNSFASPAEFFAWYNAAKDKYLAEHPGIELNPDGSIPDP